MSAEVLPAEYAAGLAGMPAARGPAWPAARAHHAMWALSQSVDDLADLAARGGLGEAAGHEPVFGREMPGRTWAAEPGFFIFGGVGRVALRGVPPLVGDVLRGVLTTPC
jgi:hypothetical protein